MKYRQKIDKAASDQLERILGTFPKSWMLNSEKSQDGEYCFDGFADSDSVSLGYDAKKQLLGGVYSLVFNLTRENVLWDGEGEAKLCYKGRMIKGDAYFTAGKSDPSLSAWLNTQSELVRLLSELDLLSMYVSVKNEVLKVRLAPLGGAFTYTVFPPMKYGGLLPDTDLERIRKVFMILAVLFEKADTRQAAGAE